MLEYHCLLSSELYAAVFFVPVPLRRPLSLQYSPASFASLTNTSSLSSSFPWVVLRVADTSRIHFGDSTPQTTRATHGRALVLFVTDSFIVTRSSDEIPKQRKNRKD